MPADPRPRRIRNAISAKLERMIDRAVSPHAARLDEAIAGFDDKVSELHDHVVQLEGGVGHLRHELEGLHRMVASSLDDLPRLRHELLAVRASEEYEQAFEDPAPLVTVRIPTYIRSTLLVERALASIMRQTYQNFEVIVVGDGCTDEVAERIEDFGDPRVTFVNLPFRHPYPDGGRDRWCVAGAPGVNTATQMANGLWLALLGDDDELDPHHLECLLEKARSARAEMVYGNIDMRDPEPSKATVLARFPPQHGYFNFQAALMMAALRAFEFSTTSWLTGEPSDWNLCRRMIEVGVRIGYLDRVVVTCYPSTAFESPWT